MGTTPIYGFPYPDPSDLVANYPALGQDLAEDIEAVLPTLGGLSPATPTTIANSGGTATLSGNTVTFTTVSSISLNGCFTSSYVNYRMILDVTCPGFAPILNLRFRTAGTDNTSNSYQRQRLTVDNTSTSATRATDTSMRIAQCVSNIVVGVQADIFNPQIAQNTALITSSTSTDSGILLEFYGNSFSSSTVFDGFTLTPSDARTITGKVRVYGYKD
jgi:hypothetical protein